MASTTKSDTIRHIKSKFFGSTPRNYVVGNHVGFLSMKTTMFASPMVSLKNSHSPFFSFGTVSFGSVFAGNSTLPVPMIFARIGRTDFCSPFRCVDIMLFALVVWCVSFCKTMLVADALSFSVFGYLQLGVIGVTYIHFSRCPGALHGFGMSFVPFQSSWFSRFSFLSLGNLALRFFGHLFAFFGHGKSPKKTGLIRWNPSGSLLVSTTLLAYKEVNVKQAIPSQQERLRIGSPGVCDGQG